MHGEGDVGSVGGQERLSRLSRVIFSADAGLERPMMNVSVHGLHMYPSNKNPRLGRQCSRSKLKEPQLHHA